MTMFALNFTTAVLDPRITFTRVGNTATRVNESGVIENVNANIARFNYNLTTLACLGLLIEQSAINILRYSDGSYQQSVITSWSNTASSFGTITSPRGVSTELWTVPAGGSATSIYKVEPCVASTVYTWSFYARLGTLPAADLKFAVRDDSNDAFIATDIVPLQTPTNTGWTRIAYTFTTPAGCTLIRPYLIRSTSVSGGTVAFSSAQLEVGSVATSYIPTVASTVTRNADVATITGTNFSDWWKAGTGGAQVQAIPSTVSGIRPLVQFDDNTANEIIALRGNTTNPELYIVDGGAPQAQLDAGTIAANTAYNLTGWWDTNDCKARQNSGATVSDYTATIPTVTQMRIGSDGTNYLNGTIATINYYDSFFGQPIYTRRKNKVFPSLL
jgi:predicted secreted protein